MARKRNEVLDRVRARQQAAREKRNRIVRYPSQLPSIERITPLVGKDSGYAWYALLVSPQKEFAVQEILTRKGFLTYCPTDKRWRKSSRYVREKELRSFPLVPGYLFVGMPAYSEPWHEVFKVNMVRGCIGYGGKPFAMPPTSMERMVRRFRNGFQRPTEEKFMRTYKEFKAGDVVRIAEGFFQSFEVPVIEIDGLMATVLVEIFGVQKPVRIETESLEPAA